MIIVLDANIWISALRFGGTTFAIVNTILATHTVVICTQIEEEVRDVLGRKFRLSEAQISRLVDPYFAIATRVTITGTLQTRCRDPKDHKILECATIAQADIILTGDQDLLSMEVYGSVRILNMADYLAERL